MTKALLALALACLVGSCDGPLPEPPPQIDVEAPRIPWLERGAPDIPWADGSPLAWTCPPGWASGASRAAPDACEPWPEGRPSCDRTSMLVPGGVDYVPVGSACPAGEWPEDVPATGAVYVRAGTPGGDGSRDAPFATIAEAVAAVPDGGTIVVGPGSYVETVVLQRSVTIRGVCAAETILTRAAPPAAMASEAQTVEIRGAEVVLRDLTIGRVPVAAVRVIGGSLDARGVVFEDYGFAGVRASGGAQVAVHDSSFRGGSSTGAGLLLQGVTTELRRVHMQRTRVVGIYAEGGTLDGEDVAIIGVPALTPLNGVGVRLAAGVEARLARTTIEEAQGQGVLAVQSDTVLDAEHLVVRDTLGMPDGTPSAAVTLDASSLTARGMWVDGGNGYGLLSVTGAVDIEDLVVTTPEPVETGIPARLGEATSARIARARLAGFPGVGLVLELDTTFEAEDLAIEAPASTGMVLSTGVVARANRVRMRGARSIAVLEQRGSTLELRNVVASGAENGILVTDENDVLLEDALLNEAAPFAERGSRMFCINGARAVMRRVVVDGGSGNGADVFTFNALSVPASTLLMEDVVLRNLAAPTDPEDDATSYGVWTVDRSEVTLRRVLLEDFIGTGLALTGAATLDDVTIRRIGPRPVDGRYGRGLLASAGAAVDGARVWVEETADAGLVAAGDATRVTLSDVSIVGTGAPICSQPCLCAHGVSAMDGARVSLTHFALLGNHGVGVQAVRGGVVELHDGTIRGSAAARQFDDPAYDAQLTEDRTTFFDNDVEQSYVPLCVPPPSVLPP